MKITLLTAYANDLVVVNAARVSFAEKVEEMSDKDRGLINYLMRNKHGTPFEHGYFNFHVEAPIFVFREWHRHRVGHSYNEMSGRYTELEEKFYWPTLKKWRTQVGKPGNYSYELLSELTGVEANIHLDRAYCAAWYHYKSLLALGVAKEQARAVLPLGIYSQMYWSCNPRSLMHFLSLRNASDAQEEIRELAAQAEYAFEQEMPITAEAFRENGHIAP